MNYDAYRVSLIAAAYQRGKERAQKNIEAVGTGAPSWDVSNPLRSASDIARYGYGTIRAGLSASQNASLNAEECAAFEATYRAEIEDHIASLQHQIDRLAKTLVVEESAAA